MDEKQLKDRMRKFGLSVIDLVERLPKSRVGDIIARQLLRSATSVGANYRAVCRARSRADFLSKFGIVEEELDESIYWLELISDRHLLESSELKPVLREGNELLAITVTSIKTSRNRKEIQ